LWLARTRSGEDAALVRSDSGFFKQIAAVDADYRYDGVSVAMK